MMEEGVVERALRLRRWEGKHWAVLRSVASAFMHGLAWQTLANESIELKLRMEAFSAP